MLSRTLLYAGGKRKEGTARGQRMLLAFSQAAQAVQRARTADEVYRIIGGEVVGLGYNAFVLTLTEDRAHLVVSYLSLQPGLLQVAEKMSGLKAQSFRFPLVVGGFFQRIITEGKTVFSDRFSESIAEALPRPLRTLAGRLANMLRIEQGIVARLMVGGEQRIGLHLGRSASYRSPVRSVCGSIVP